VYRINAALWARIHQLRAPQAADRGETGPLGYAVMVSAIVLLAIFVAAWGQDVAEYFMNQVEGVSVGGDGGSGD
jgi:hypothetical protein